MRILHVMAGARHGGAETACIDMCLAMHEAGHHVALATRGNPRNERLRQAGISVYTLSFGGALDVFTPWQLKRVMKKFQPDIVQTWMARAAHKTPCWRPGMQCPRYLVVSRLGGYYSLKYFRSAQYFTTITPMIRDYLIKEGVAGDTIRHINNFAETETAPVPVDRKAMGVPEGTTLLLGLGRLHEGKAFDVLIKAVKDAANTYLWIAGEGPERESLTHLIQSLGLEGRVKLLGWRDDRAALLQAADICVFCSRYEPFGTVFVQAWAQRTPLIVSDADGPRQFVTHDVDGLIVPAGEAEPLAAAILRLSSDKTLAERLAAAGWERYQANFTKDKSVSQYIDFYREIRSREAL
jgi:glycosyltransferase involved in cell wall biosynthesis